MNIIQTVSTALQSNLNEELDELAREYGVVIRERKFKGSTLLLMIVITLLRKPDATWADFHLTAALLGIKLTETAIQKRFTAGQPLVDFFREALQRALKKTIAAHPSAIGLLEKFTAVLIGDATSIALPDELAHLFAGCGGSEGTSQAALKIQVLWNLKTGEIVQLLIEAGKASDAKSPIAHTEVQEGNLFVFDLGYFDLDRFAEVDAKGGKFISRLQHGTAVFSTDGLPLDLLAHLAKQPTGLLDQMILLGAAVRLCCRLVAIRVPQEVANRRRQKAYEKAAKKGRVPTAEYLELLGWSIFVTNCSQEELTWKAVVVLYRARWQIELLFKLWKSHNKLSTHRAGAKALEILAIFYAKLLGIVLQHWILVSTAWSMESRSLFKAARALADMVKEILLALKDSAALQAALLRLRDVIEKLGGTTDRITNPSHAQLLNDPELLDWLCHEDCVEQ
jgi:DDE family transposase